MREQDGEVGVQDGSARARKGQQALEGIRGFRQRVKDGPGARGPGPGGSRSVKMGSVRL